MSVGQILSGSSPFHFLRPEEREEHLRARNRGDVVRVAQLEKTAYERFANSQRQALADVALPSRPTAKAGGLQQQLIDLGVLADPNQLSQFYSTVGQGAGSALSTILSGLGRTQTGQAIGQGLSRIGSAAYPMLERAFAAITDKEGIGRALAGVSPLLAETGADPQLAEAQGLIPPPAPREQLAPPIAPPVRGGVAVARPAGPKAIPEALSPTSRAALMEVSEPVDPAAIAAAQGRSPAQQRIMDILEQLTGARGGIEPPEKANFSERLARFLSAAALGAQRGLQNEEGATAAVLSGAGGFGLGAVSELKREERLQAEKFKSAQEESKFKALQLEMLGATNLAQLDARDRALVLQAEANAIRAYSARNAAMTGDARRQAYQSTTILNAYKTELERFRVNDRLLGVNASADSKAAARAASFQAAPEVMKPAILVTMLVEQGNLPELRQAALNRALNGDSAKGISPGIDPTGETYRNRLVLLRQQGAFEEARAFEKEIIADEIARMVLENPNLAENVFRIYQQEQLQSLGNR